MAMLLHIPRVLTAEQVAHCQETLVVGEWVDGKITAGGIAAKAKNNMQVSAKDPVAQQLSDMVVRALGGNALFLSAAMPLEVSPPLFNRYQDGQSYGVHFDAAVIPVPGARHRLRTDLAATLFLSAPDAYDGGELTLEGVHGGQQIKLPAGDMVLYPASSLHSVRPVTRGVRLASVFWVQSLVRGDDDRQILLDLDIAVQRIRNDDPDDPSVLPLTGIYQNLLRRWSAT
jgi:PKHD-type hydroxylase